LGLFCGLPDGPVKGHEKARLAGRYIQRRHRARL